MTNDCTFTWNFFILYCVLTCFSTSALTFGNRTRFRRQDDCGFICSSGKCISKELVCDGHEDCQDGNDETSFCKNFSCRDFYFRCHYGACVPKSKICNRQTDCRDNSDESSCKSPPKNTTCDKDQFECSNGQCISSVLICNGLADCLDKSDESQAICSQIVCPKYTYRCDYGACISTRGKCNGIQDCLDNSDEDPKNCGKENLYCPLPIAPENGSWELATNNKNSSVTSLPYSTVIYYKCNKGYKLVPQVNISLCIGNKWEPTFKPKCLRACLSIVSTEKVMVKCYWKGQHVSCVEPADGTNANFTCNTFYEPRNVRSQQRWCVDGTWDLPLHECRPTCGQVDTDSKPLNTSNEPEFPPGKYPWHAAIYIKFRSSYKYVCGGTMLSERVILTAAHCVSDNNNGNSVPKENFQVAVGKHFSGYNNTETTAQFSQVTSIHIHESFKGAAQHFKGDIALLVTEKKFEISRYVQPICFDEENNIQLIDGQMGVVVGWSLPQEKGKPMDILRELFIPVTDKKTCIDSYPTKWVNQIFFPDKMCAGYVDRKIKMCTGSNGNSISFRKADDNRLYIQGLVSYNGPEEDIDADNCIEQHFGLFTNIANYTRFIGKIMREAANS